MSIDNFWSLPTNKEHPVFDPPIKIESSPYGKGTSSFKGKKYSIFLENELSLTLFKRKILPEEVEVISTKLKSFIDTRESKTATWSIYLSNQEILDLSRMFTTYTKLNASLAGWW